MPNKIKVSVVIPVYNREDFIRSCLDSVLNQTMRDYEVILVDDGSTDRTVEIARSFNDKRLKIHSNKKNCGLCYSRNQGVALAQGDFVAFTDSDCIVDAAWLEELLKPFATDPRIWIVGGRVLDPESTSYWQQSNMGSSFIARQSGYVSSILGCNMAYNSHFLVAHPFDERLRFAGDEIDRCLACAEKHGKIYYTSNAVVRHYHRYSTKSALMQQFRYGYSWFYVNVKHKRPPYFAFGALLLLIEKLAWVLFFSGVLSGVIPAVLKLLFLGLVLYFHLRAGGKSAVEAIYTYPGKLILFITFCIGNLVAPIIYSRIFKAR